VCPLSLCTESRRDVAPDASPERLRHRNRLVGAVLIGVLASLYALAIWGVVVLN
jgi:hypothetical protein